MGDVMKKRTRLEKLSSIVELSIDSLLKYMKTDEERIYVYRYNYSIGEFHREIEKNINVNTAILKVSKFMEQLICNHITKIQSIELVYHRFPGYDNIKLREKKISKLRGL